MTFKKDEWILLASHDCTLPGRPEDYGLPPAGTPCTLCEVESYDPETRIITTKGPIASAHKLIKIKP